MEVEVLPRFTLHRVTFLCPVFLKKFNVKLMTILIYSDSSGNPGAEEESESKKNQQKVSGFCSTLDVLRHLVFFICYCRTGVYLSISWEC